MKVLQEEELYLTHQWHMIKSPETTKRQKLPLGPLPVGRWHLSSPPHMCTIVASYQKLSEIPEGIQIANRNSFGKNTPARNTTNQQHIAVTPVVK